MRRWPFLALACQQFLVDAKKKQKRNFIIRTPGLTCVGTTQKQKDMRLWVRHITFFI